MAAAATVGPSGDLEHKFHRPEAGLRLTDGAMISGYASVFGRRDQGGDEVAPGAFAHALVARAGPGGRRVAMLWQHDPGQPIGVWDELREDAHGLYVRGRILTEVARGREALALVSAGALDGLSIGYRVLRAERLAGGARKLIAIDLWEVSLVTFPMLSEARIATAPPAAKGGDGLVDPGSCLTSGPGSEPASEAEAVLGEIARAVTNARRRFAG